MFKKTVKRLLSAVLAAIIIMSTLFIHPFAFDLSDKESLKSLFGIEEGDACWDVLLEMNAVLLRYLGSSNLTEDEIVDAVINMDWDTMQNAVDDIDELREMTEDLSEEEREKVLATDTAESIGTFSSTLELATSVSTFASSSYSVLNGSVLITDSQGTGSVSGNSVTVTVKSGLFGTKSNTVDIYNNTDKISTLKFNYNISNHSSFSLGNASGTYSVLLYPDANISLTFEAGAGNKTATLRLTDFELIPVADNSDITFDFDSKLGSVKVNGTAAASGTPVNLTLENGGELVATPANGAKFIGWVDPSNNFIYSTSATYHYTPVGDATIKAVFVGKNSVAYFSTNSNKYLFEDLNKAVSYAKSSGETIIVPVNDGTLPAGDYTVPSGVTLLIPFDSANTVYTDAPEAVHEVRTTPTAFRTLTMANGANITVNGTLCVPAKHYTALGSKQNGGSPDGPCGFIRMNEGSNIVVNNGGKLYAYGFIIGSGKVTAKSGASVYEYFQIMDFRGGTQTSEMKNGVFPLSQYYVQNIEVPLTLEAGAVENSYTSVRMSNMTLGSGISFIAKSDAMFNLTSGSVTKRYDPLTDRLVVEVDGTISISPIEMQIGSGILSTKIDSKKYELPINGNITVKINSGSITLAQDIAMLPGSEIIIGENATCALASGTNVYLYDSSEWGGFCAPSNKKFIPVQYAPGRKYNRKEADLKDATIQVEGIMDASAGYVYTTKSGANIFSTGKGEALLKKGSETVTYQLVQNTGYSEIAITPAKLKNADGTYKATTSANSANYYVNGVWIEHTSHIYTETVVQVADCEKKGIKTYSCPCGSTYTEETPALGHSAGAAATCTTNQICTVCGKELNPEKGHNYQIAITEATCTTGGYTTHTCLTCGNTYVDNEVAAKGHIAGAEATCTDNQTCTVCGEELAAALGHSYQTTVIAPTCTDGGHTEHICLTCGDSYIDNETSALGHTAGAEATCTEPQICVTCGEILKSENGHTAGAEATCTQAQTCLVCGDKLSPALGHEMIHNEAQDATCTEDGFSSGSHCARCDHTEGKHVIPAKGHSLTSAATCTRNQTCTVCGIITETAKGHNYVTTVYLPTCTQNGYSVHTCLNCDDSYADGEVPAKGHKIGSDISCTKAQLCQDCGSEIAPAKGHTPGAEATCGAAQTCTDCGEELAPAKGHTPGIRATCLTAQVCTVCDQEIVPALGHKFREKVTVATCTESGSTVHTCSRCRYKYVDGEIPATGHNMSAATCTEPSTCLNNCGHTEGEALGHKEVIDEEMPAFCTQDGHTEGSHCSVCGEIIIAQEIIPALGHNIVKYEAKNPTYTSVGWEAYEDCTRCAYTTYVEIPKLDAPTVTDYDSFIENLLILEELAYYYSMEVPGVDPLELVIKYIRTGVDRYNEGSWGIMAGYEDAGFAEFVAKMEDEQNSVAGSDDELIEVSSLKNIETFNIPNGDLVDFGHMFGTMDITYHNKKSINHADVGGWAGDICDLMEFSDYGDVTGTLNEMIAEISVNYLLQDDPEEVGGFNQQDMYGDLDSYYLMKTLLSSTYEQGDLTALFEGYFTADLTMEIRADYFIENRLGGVSTRANIRDEVYNLYTGNKLITTLEGTKEFKRTEVSDLRKACCYAFADYICKLAGDYVEVTENPYYTVFSTETTTLAPGIIQNIKKATTADNKQMVYYTATADLSRDDVHIFANYKNNDPTVWGMQTVLAQATAAQNKYGNPESEQYIENYNVIASINGDGYNMSTGEPGGLLIMDGKEYHPIDGGGFFGILEDGTAVIGTQAEYNSIYKDRVKEGIGGFGITLIKDGEIAVKTNSNYFKDRASRTAVGITRTGKVVFMVLDGRQEPISCGGDAMEIAQIMFEAGCVNAINLDGGGSTTYVAKLEGADEIAVVSRPSDGTSRSVSTSLLMVSTAPSSTAFDHAIVESETDYLTKGASLQLAASGVSATGNAAELPEGTTWAVSDEKWGTVTADGIFTGLRNGSVDVYLMLGEEILGSKTLNIVDPDRVYFSKSNINATYGIPASLPVVALYENKPVTILTSDITFSLSNPAAGTVSGFEFTGSESSGVKNVIVYAALAADPEKTASLNVSLYNKGEVSFDFDNAVGGDRMLAWDRVVSNSTTEDNSVYEIVDANEQMVTSYTFAIDMTQIPIPDQLADLTTMLPGAELENASAWNFLLQLAERVSVLTVVKPTVKIDPNFEVDYSKVTIVNECFELNGVELDEETNTLTLILNWKDQTQAIDPETANPHCILSGIKITPKEGVEWPKDKLSVVNSGEISYKMYMRANALYTFSNNPENQKVYGLYPFINPNDPNEKGGYFGSVYAQFEDTYTLSKAIKEGWVNEEGGFAYYKDGVRYTGVKLIDGYYYDFGENGINVGQTTYTGLFYDEAEDVYRYSKLGTLASGWQMIGDDWYYFHSSTMAAEEGYYKVGPMSYNFEKTGKLSSGVWVKCVFGYRYYYGPSFYKRGWEIIDGNRYYFYDSYRYEGYRCVQESNSKDFTWYDFGTDGICKEEVIPDGFYTDKDGSLSYVVNGLAQKGLHKIDGDYYLFDYYGHAVYGEKYAEQTFCDLPTGVYRFGEDYKALNGIVELDGTLYYFENGKRKAKGLIEINGEYYFAGGSNGEIIVNTSKYVWNGNGLLPESTYEFGPDGRMLDGIVKKDGILYYYENGKPKTAGLILIDGDYYFANGSEGEICVNQKRYVWEGNGLLPEADYEFGPDGRMLDGIVKKDGVLYYYVKGKPKQAGLLFIDGNYYFANGANGEICVNEAKYVWDTNDLLPEATYSFDSDGKMLDGIVEIDSVLYYYVNGRPKQAGLIMIDNDYYFACGSNGELSVNEERYVWEGNGLLPEATYEFGPDGKMLDGLVEKDGVLYYYENGKAKQAGLIIIDGAYYFVNGSKGEVCVNKTQYVWKTNDLLPEKSYEFGPDGRMLDGIVEKDGVLYYYVTGKPKQAGLIIIDGDYYFAGGANGELSVDKKQYVWQSNGLLPESNYQFGPDGKMINGFFMQDGIRYYYVNGKPAPVGLNYVDGYYYFVMYDGSLVVNKSYYAWETNGLSVEMTYTFNELGQVIG